MRSREFIESAGCRGVINACYSARSTGSIYYRLKLFHLFFKIRVVLKVRLVLHSPAKRPVFS